MNFSLKKEDTRYITWYCMLSLLFISPFIINGVYFRDDLDRAVTGFYGWSGLARPLSDLVMSFLSVSGDKLLDYYPFTLILSSLFIGLSAYLVKRLMDSYRCQGAFLCASLVMFNPFMLQNLAYRFDSLAMSLAVLLTSLSYAYDNKLVIKSLAIKVVAGVAALSLYQSSTNLFLGILSIELIAIFSTKNISLKDTISIIFKRMTVYILSYSIYMLTIVKIWGGSNKRSELIGFNFEGIERIKTSLIILNEIIETYISGSSAWYFIATLSVFLICGIIIAYRNNKYIAMKLSIFILSIFVFYMSLLGPTILLQQTPVYARTLVSFSCIFVIFSLVILQVSKKMAVIAILPAVVAFSFSAQSSIAMKEQAKFEDGILNMVSYDLLHKEGVNKILTVGSMKLNERTKLILENKPSVKYLAMGSTEFLITFQLKNKGLNGVEDGYGIERRNKELLSAFISEGISPFILNEMYSIYLKDGVAIIAFNEGR